MILSKNMREVLINVNRQMDTTNKNFGVLAQLLGVYIQWEFLRVFFWSSTFRYKPYRVNRYQKKGVEFLSKFYN